MYQNKTKNKRNTYNTLLEILKNKTERKKYSNVNTIKKEQHMDTK